jgi:DNA invertase Pin-like site-specific DNA recombinase
MERNFINERTTEGKRLALAKGVKMGRKGKSKNLVEYAIKLWRTGKYTEKSRKEILSHQTNALSGNSQAKTF